MKKKSFNYKMFLAIPVVIFILSVGVLVNNYYQTGEWFARSIELKGGTLITAEMPADMTAENVKAALAGKFDSNVRELIGLSGRSIMIEIGPETAPESVLAEMGSIGLSTAGASVQTIGPSLGEGFWQQAQLGIIIAFILMGVIVFGIFRDFIPSLAVIACAVSDILVTLAIMQVFGIELSLAGFAAILMLIGYSIDTDILLTTKLLKTSGVLMEKLMVALKTGLTMTVTTIVALSTLILFGLSPVLSQIASILLIGLVIDIINTWFQNAVLLRWHCERGGKK